LPIYSFLKKEQKISGRESMPFISFLKVSKNAKKVRATKWQKSKAKA
jgi:hypothetical protein